MTDFAGTNEHDLFMFVPFHLTSGSPSDDACFIDLERASGSTTLDHSLVRQLERSEFLIF